MIYCANCDKAVPDNLAVFPHNNKGVGYCKTCKPRETQNLCGLTNPPTKCDYCLTPKDASDLSPAGFLCGTTYYICKDSCKDNVDAIGRKPSCDCGKEKFGFMSHTTWCSVE